MTEPKVYTFGPFRLEAGERRLLREGQPVPVAGKTFELLELLVEGAGALQKQQTLMDRLWPDVVVEQNNLQYHISLLRRALGEVAGVEIQTVRGQGYRLVATVRSEQQPTAAPAAPLRLQQTRFCRAHDGTRLACARLGEGAPFVKAANWLSHLEVDWQGPVWRHWLDFLSRDRCLIRYDARGNGLSDWQPRSITFEDFIEDLASVFDAAGVARAPVLGISQGASVAASYAARHPERVSALVLLNGCARGWRVKQNYRLAPEHPSPAALDDALVAFQYVRALRPRVPIFVSGDSAGGGLVLSLLARLRDRAQPLPAGAILLSPWTDLTSTARTLRRDRWLTPAHLKHWAAHYAGATKRENPELSPVLADLSRLPPLLLLAGEEEILLDDALRVAEAANRAGTHASVIVGKACSTTGRSRCPGSTRASERGVRCERSSTRASCRRRAAERSARVCWSGCSGTRRSLDSMNQRRRIRRCEPQQIPCGQSARHRRHSPRLRSNTSAKLR